MGFNGGSDTFQLKLQAPKWKNTGEGLFHSGVREANLELASQEALASYSLFITSTSVQLNTFLSITRWFEITKHVNIKQWSIYEWLQSGKDIFFHVHT